MPTLLAWAPKGQATIGAIEMPEGTTLTEDGYLNRLSFRIKELAMEADSDDLRQAVRSLNEAGLLDQTYLEPQEAGTLLIWENWEMRAHLRDLGIPGNLIAMDRVTKENYLAREALDETTLAMWAAEVAGSRIERD